MSACPPIIECLSHFMHFMNPRLEDALQAANLQEETGKWEAVVNFRLFPSADLVVQM
ncbi:hypothetical protein KC19_12G057000 [Ceratodon purpureus]|uniref:Uncharacterized protein n=1 Tax=Ceratodon purpureus TaxID=3225 RepID=A0A8T0G4Q7_CERPU|nr:hypothetical protein KC19_12G057000 [Ceratodon purpureus]